MSYRRSTLRKWRMVIVDNAEQCRHRLKVMIGWFSLEQFNDSATKTPDIRGCSCACQLNYFGRHPVRSPNNARFIKTRRTASHAKVCELHETFFGGENISALDVTVYDTLLMQIQETVQNL